MEISSGIFFGLISMVGFGLSNAMSQVPAKNIGSRRTIFFRNVFVSLILLVILSFFISEVKFSKIYILITLVISLIAYIPLLTFYKALKLGKVGVITPIASSSVVFTVLFSIIFFKESLTWIQGVSIISIITGIILISLNFSDIKNSNLFNISSGVPFALISCIFWGLSFFLFKIPVIILGPILTSFIVEFGVMIFSAINLKISKIYFDIPNRKDLRYIFMVAFFGATGTLFFNLGIRSSDVSIVAALTFANPFVSTLYGKFAYKENLNISQYISILLILTGIILRSYL